jgi:citrate synthase
MINRRLTVGETAERLGVKPATVYAYVSRGLLHREKTATGSTFDLHEVARVARSARNPGQGGQPPRRRDVEMGEGTPNEPVFVTELTLIDSGRLYYRGLDAVELSRTRTFEDVAGWLWTGMWPDRSEGWVTPPAVRAALARSFDGPGVPSLPIERYMVATMAAGLSDDLRHDLNPAGVPVTGRILLSTLADSLERSGSRSSEGALSARMWSNLTSLPLTPERQAVLEAALVLAADHELAPSTLAARVAAAFRADPYAVVMTGLGPASGSWYSGSSGAPTEVETLLAEAMALDAERAIGERLRRTGTTPHGFGMPLYPEGDPRGRELLLRLDGLDASPERRAVVRRIVQVAAERGFPPPNVDLGLGALAFCAQMVPGAGQAISTLGKVAGWLAHAMEEYSEPTRFRSRADYVGRPPAATEAGSGG